MKMIVMGVVTAGLLLIQTGCATNEVNQASALGAGLGAGLGMVLGHNFGHSEHDRLLGAAAGAAVGGLMARQRAEQQQIHSRIDGVQQQQHMVTIWVANPNGSRTPVLLRAAEGGQYIGPRGEYYAGVPGEDQLRPVYGL